VSCAIALGLLVSACTSAESGAAAAGTAGTAGDAATAPGEIDAALFQDTTATLDAQGRPVLDAAGVPPDDDGACPGGTHLGPNGLCTQDVCLKDSSTCSDPQTVKLCNEDGSDFEEVLCPSGQICQLGACWAPICEPGAQAPVCDGGKILKCNSLGTAWVAYPCGVGEACTGGLCKPVPPNILFLVDTSGSMNWMPDGTGPEDCSGGPCPSWTMPNCDDGPTPFTRLGKVKAAMRAVLGSDAVTDMRLALQRFAQEPTSEWLYGLPCAGGFWTPAGDVGLMTGDIDPTKHLAPAFGWFGQNLDEILLVPFPESGETDLDALGLWLDGVETATLTGPSCLLSEDCPGGPCLHDVAPLNYICAELQNPELRAVGGTPLGKSLFYAGEYLRSFVFVDGKACVIDSDCQSSNHTCQSGTCHDPFAECRPTVIIAFTDGEETENVHVDDFFHPRVQAKRLHYGLGCQSDDDCLSGATCGGFRCVPPSGDVDEAATICETGGGPCTTTSDCPDPCATWTSCQGYCTTAQVDVTDGNGSDHLFSHSGASRAVTVHVVDASGSAGANEYVASYGGGMHFSVDLADPEVLVSTVTSIIGDTKSAGPCGGP